MIDFLFRVLLGWSMMDEVQWDQEAEWRLC